jgi:hypothetical protein
MSFKECIECRVSKEPECFAVNKRNADGYDRICVDCCTSQSDETKFCKYCNKLLNVSLFNICRSRKDGLSFYCRICTNAKCRKYWHDKNQLNTVRNPSSEDQKEIHTCNRCHTPKAKAEFPINLAANTGISKFCLECKKPKSTSTPEQKRCYAARYKQNNPEALKEKYRKQNKNIHRKIRSSLNSRINAALNSQGRRKGTRTFEYIGCSMQHFMKWFEFQFVDGMTWENKGQWHIDHVKPCSSYDLTNSVQVEECFHWTNLQPLWGCDNMKKHDKVDLELIEKHKESVSIS